MIKKCVIPLLLTIADAGIPSSFLLMPNLPTYIYLNHLSDTRSFQPDHQDKQKKGREFVGIFSKKRGFCGQLV